MMQRNILLGTLTQAFVEKVHAERARRFRRVHGQFRQLDQFLHLSGILREHSDADTGGHINMVVFNIQGIEQVTHNRFSAHFGLGRLIDIAQHHGEFIAANPRQ
ncbi:hypothetical protein CWI79_06200 [Pseudidiomarina salinarum]|nr:hypothetical protein [Pseudidiomarina salinarum]RUO71027.1 hypothetical protein CWI79_06200 [Pseudidiomarina salinarum]